MKYEPKYDLGCKVYLPRRLFKETVHKCPMCRGHREVTVNGHTAKCPKCLGAGVGKREGRTKWIVSEALTIGEIQLCHQKNRRPEWRYMCVETGVGSGSIYNEKQLYPSHSEAHAACDEWNGEGPKAKALWQVAHALAELLQPQAEEKTK